MEENKLQVMNQEIKVETIQEFAEPKWMKILGQIMQNQKIHGEMQLNMNKVTH